MGTKLGDARAALVKSSNSDNWKGAEMDIDAFEAAVRADALAKMKPRKLDNCRGFHETINEACTCGGAGPELGCPACKVYHEIKDWEVVGP